MSDRSKQRARISTTVTKEGFCPSNGMSVSPTGNPAPKSERAGVLFAHDEAAGGESPCSL